MTECLFDITDSIKNFGIDGNGLLTCSEKDFMKTFNPYVDVLKMPNNDARLQVKLNIPNAVLNEIHDQPWFVEACNKGKINAKKYANSRDSHISIGGFAKEDVLKAAYIGQTIRFGESGPEYMTALLKAIADGNFKEVREQIINEIVKDMPKFEHPALKAYDSESYVRMRQAIIAKYKLDIQRFNRLFNNTYAKDKSKRFDAATDKLNLLMKMAEKRLNFLLDEARVLRVKKRGAFDVNEYFLKALQKA